MNATDRAKQWLTETYDMETRHQVQSLIESGGDALEDAFYKDLVFGTGGMRGIMGVGTNRLNKYTIGAATQGLANYLRKSVDKDLLKVAIAYDVRHNSSYFGKVVADVLSANGIQVYLFEDFRPTPELSFAVRHLVCDAGIVLTASHNPPEYNGFKAYWSDGAQIVPPHDQGIIEEVRAVSASDICFDGNEELIAYLGSEMDDLFLQACIEHTGYNDLGKRDLKIVFTSIHGTSIQSIPPALHKAGFEQVFVVEEQAVPDGGFSTVDSPNPEEPEALSMALALAEERGADIVIGTDPDADRLGIAVRDLSGKMVLLNGNQTNAVLTDYLLSQWQKAGRLQGREFIGTTIVTSDIMFDIAEKYNVECEAVLTGFKWIGKAIKDTEGNKKFICGGEESFGFMVDDFVRDKDSVTSTVLACEVAAALKSQGSSFYQRLLEIYTETQCYQEGLKSLKKEGKKGAEQIQAMMADFRRNPPKEILGSPVVLLNDYSTGLSKNLRTGDITILDLPKSNVLVFNAEDGTRVAVRPSGTEPKIKFYFSVRKNLMNIHDYDIVQSELNQKIEALENLFVNNK